jgi:ubiquinone/menaquinone biosynthesis C-methylase UbiE
LKQARVFAGCVDYWDGRLFGGWAIDRTRPSTPCDIDIYAEGQLLQTCRADIQRPDLIEVSPADQRKGFLVDIEAKVKPGARLEVCFGGTRQRIPPTQQLEPIIGRPHIDFQQRSASASSRWVPVPPASMITHISGATGKEADLRMTYRAVGFTVAADICNMALDHGADPLRPGYSFVDLGCGCGRIATFLAQMLDDSRYLGVDVWRPGIEWAERNITSKYEKYLFHCPVAHKHGYEARAHCRVPVEDGTTDCVIATSLFTHIDPGACDGYLREIGRILKPGGLAYITFFFRDEQSSEVSERMARRAGMVLTKDPQAWSYGKAGYLDVFHDPHRVEAVAAQEGLESTLIRLGVWRGMAHSSVNHAAYQDLLFLRKAGPSS